MNKPQNPATRVITGKVRFSYAHLFEPRASAEGAEPRYSLCVLIDKSDKETLAKVKTAFAAAEALGVQTVWQGKKPAGYKYPVVRDGDVERPDSEGYAGCWFINANAKSQPAVVDANVQPILDRNEVYSGCYGRVSLNFYPYNQAGNKGIGCGLGNVQKLADGVSLGGRTKPEDDFGTPTETDDLPWDK